MRIRLNLEEGWSTLFILWAILLTSTTAIVDADLIGGLHIVSIVGSIALFTGLLLAKSRFRPNMAHLFSLIFGLFVLFYLLGSLLPESMLWRDRVWEIVTRQYEWFQKAFGSGTSRDGLIFVIQTTAIYWVLGYTAAWYTFRRPRVWLAVIPTGVVLLSVVYYYTGPKQLTLYMAVYVLLALLFVARTYLVDQEKSWRLASVRYESGIWFAFLRAGFLVSLVALIFAWTLPTMAASAAVGDALSGTRGPWRDFQDNWTRLFSALRSYGANTSDPYQNTLVLGGPRSAGRTPIMDIHVSEQLPYVYWQAIVYDTYEDGRWSTADTESNLHFPDDGLIDIPDMLAREVVTQTVVNYLPNSSFIYGAPEIVGVNRQIFVDASKNEDGDNLVTTIRSRFVLQQGTRYEVTSQLSMVDQQSLRQAPTGYPSWIADTYLQVPDTITAETLSLAKEISEGLTTPFDIAIAVRDYLRENITYNDQIAAPPEDVDPVHYTLFVSQEGYCNYYASAMSMMLRTLGIPSRVVSGYAQGEYNEDLGAYRVRASNAHTWVEVFFPAYGWIQFEPTAAIPTVDRPEAPGGGGDAFPSSSTNDQGIPPEDELPFLQELEPSDAVAGGLPQAEGATGFAAWLSQFSVWRMVGAILTVVLSFVALVLANEVNKRIESDVERSYGRLGKWASWIGVWLRPAHTPYERADLMASAVPDGKTPIRSLTQQYVRKQFSQQRSVEPGFDSRQEWRVLRPILLRQALLERLRRLRTRRKRR